MDKPSVEKRQFPRINIKLPIKITPEFLGQTIDLSETGLKFVLQKPLLLSKAKAVIEISPGESVETEFKVVWNKHLAKENKFTYGICLIRLKERDLSILRSILLQNYVDAILNKTNGAKERELIKKYWNNDFAVYLEKLSKVSAQIEDGLNEDEAFKIVDEFNETVMQKGNMLEKNLDNAILIKKIKKYFRDACGPWVYRSAVVKHAYQKPRGYPGDHALLEIIYENKPISTKIGYCYDKYFLKNPYAVAVRNRKDKMKNILKELLSSSGSSKIKILNLACGSARELKELFIENKGKLEKNVFFSLVDQDKEALDFSRHIFKNIDANITFNYFQHNILEYINESDKFSDLLGPQDIIYSIGLTDYLPDRILKKLIFFCFHLLEVRGKVIIAHKDVSEYKPLPPDWWCDWTFYPRDEQHLLNLITKSGISNFKLEVEREPSKIVFFVTIEKIK